MIGCVYFVRQLFAARIFRSLSDGIYLLWFNNFQYSSIANYFQHTAASSVDVPASVFRGACWKILQFEIVEMKKVATNQSIWIQRSADNARRIC